MKAFLLLCLVGMSMYACAQSIESRDTAIVEKTIQSATSISERSLHFIDAKYTRLTTTVENQSLKLLARMQRKEALLQKKVALEDTSLAHDLFAGSQNKYEDLKKRLQLPIDKTIPHQLKQYIPGLDSLETSLNFLKTNGVLQNLSTGKLKEIGAITDQLQGLEGRLQQANEIQSFIRQRERELKSQLVNLGLAKQVMSINKEVYYYQQRLTEYKSLLNDKKKLEEKAIAIVRELPEFKAFMQKHSYLARLFPASSSTSSPAIMNGLQTRANIQQQMTRALSAGGNGTNPQAYLQQQMQGAQSQLTQLKDKLNKLSGGSSEMTMPDFKPNNQKTKSFLQRLEYGVTIQSQKGTSFLPGTSDIGAMVGYKFSDKKTLGVGLSYKLGLGKSLRNIHLSNEGIGLRSYLDIKAKGSIWVSGGFEMNYMQGFKKFEELKDVNLWQQSALIGLTKKYKVGKKEGKLQLLYDFLHQQQNPRSAALQFRIGYTL